jgi:hypothetical protein
MDNVQITSQEDAALEAAALSETKADEIRAKVITDYGLDPAAEGHEDLIQKITADKLEERKKLATAIRQKKDWREKAQKPSETPATETPTEPKPKPEVEDISKLVDAKLDERLDSQKLEEITLSDDAKEDLKAYAKSKGMTVRAAIKTDYYEFLTNSETRKQRDEDASTSRSTRTAAKNTFDPDKPPTVDMSTPEGRETWDKYVEQLKKT